MTNDKDGAALLREAIHNALSSELGDTYDCGRVWDAWHVGTMGEDDFTPVNDRVDEITETVLAALKSHGQAFDTAGVREACAHMVARCEALEDESHNALATDLDNHAAGFHRGQKSTAKALRREFHDLTRTLKSHGQAFDAALLDRAELAWQRFFYPAADNFEGPTGDKLPSVDLEVADCLRLVLAAAGRHVVTPKFDVPAIQNVARDARLKTVAEKLAAFTGAPYEDWRHFTVEAGDILDRLDNLPTNAAPQPAFDAADIEGLAYDVHHHWSVGHKDEAVAAILRFCPLVDTAGVREACAKECEKRGHVTSADAIRAIPTPEAPASVDAKVEAYDQMHEIAKEMGFPSILEALESIPEPDTIGSHFGNGGGLDPVADHSGDATYLICKGGAYYRPNAQGYTRNRSEAGRYTLEEAISYSHPNGPDGPRDGITYELALSHDQRGGAGE